MDTSKTEEVLNALERHAEISAALDFPENALEFRQAVDLIEDLTVENARLEKQYRELVDGIRTGKPPRPPGHRPVA